jgi:hypothetical protein
MLIDSHSTGVYLLACPSFAIQRRDVYPPDQMIAESVSGPFKRFSVDTDGFTMRFVLSTRQACNRLV